MTIKDLCVKINLQNEIAEDVIKFSDSFDFNKIRIYLDGLKDGEKEARVNRIRRLFA